MSFYFVIYWIYMKFIEFVSMKHVINVFGLFLLLLVPFPFSFEWLVHHKPGEVCSGLCLHQTTIRWMLSLHCA